MMIILSKRYMAKFLETAIDFVTLAATASGMAAESPRAQAEEAVESAVGVARGDHWMVDASVAFIYHLVYVYDSN